MRDTLSPSGSGHGHGRVTTPRGIEWAKRRVAVIAGVATIGGIMTMAPAGAVGPGPSTATVNAGPEQTVLVTAAVRPDPYNSATAGDPVANDIDATVRSIQTDAVDNVVTAATGDDGTDLDAANGVVATVTPAELAVLQSNPDVVVTPNVPVAMADASLGSGLLSTVTSTVGTVVSGLSATTPVATLAPTRAPAAVFPQLTGATTLWSKGFDGNGVTVAVLDTGITKSPDLKHVIGGVDFSGEGNPYQDSYGHGTFVSGLIAGAGASSHGQYMGEAPNANLVAVKVAGATGMTDVATVIKGINWVVNNADKYKIRVLNMSLGAIPVTSSVLNPLDQAVETAWQAGIVVVVSAGNSGPFNGTILSPGDDPLAITVGSLDDTGSTDPTQATSTSFSSVGPTNPDGWFKPDLVTSGRSVVSLRAPGSTIDITNPTAQVGKNNFVGSGTSFSAAITSGAAALEIQSSSKWGIKGSGQFPITADQVKAQLLGTTTAGPVGNPLVDGHGALNVLNAASNPGLQLKQVVPTTPTRMGATVNLHDTWLGSSWNGSSWNGSSWNGSSWNGSSWNGSSWNGSSWNGSSWNGSSWNGSSWNGSSWN